MINSKFERSDIRDANVIGKEYIKNTGVTPNNAEYFGKEDEKEKYSQEELEIISLLEAGYDYDYISKLTGFEEEKISEIENSYWNKEKRTR